MSTVPVPAGDTAVIEVAELTTNEVAGVAPNLTAVAPVKFVPVIVTLVPPVAEPLVGLIEVTVGAVAGVHETVAVSTEPRPQDSKNPLRVLLVLLGTE